MINGWWNALRDIKEMNFEVFGVSQSIGWGSPIDWSISHFCFSKNTEDQLILSVNRLAPEKSLVFQNIKFVQSIGVPCQSIGPAKFPFLQNRKLTQVIIIKDQSIGPKHFPFFPDSKLHFFYTIKWFLTCRMFASFLTTNLLT